MDAERLGEGKGEREVGRNGENVEFLQRTDGAAAGLEVDLAEREDEGGVGGAAVLVRDLAGIPHHLL